MRAFLRPFPQPRYNALLLALLIFCSSAVFAQTHAVAIPPTFSAGLSAAVPTAIMPPVDNAAFLAEDEAAYEQARQAGQVPPAQLARPHEVALHLGNSGKWESLPDGGRIWRLRIESPAATDLYLVYDQWRIVKPCELWLYNDDRSMVLGPYTYIDNWDGTNITPITDGDAVTLEYHIPPGVDDIGDLSVSRVLHGYRRFHSRHEPHNPLDAFGDSMPCMINVRCFPEWQNERNSVAMIISPMGGACSGAMINNVPQNGDPNFLTANHCLDGNQGNWLFYFNYESPQCNPNQNGSLSHVISNASLLASHASSPGSDFALLRLSRRRPDTNFIPRYEGWYRLNTFPQSTIGIHHPAADVKKIHYDQHPAEPHPENSHWRTHIDLGMMEPGSSGSPLFDHNRRIVGQLQGGTWDCDPTTENTADYGKFSMSWDYGSNSTTRLREHLDPGNTGAAFVNAFQPVAPPNDSCGPGQTVPLITSLPYSHSGSTMWAANNHRGSVGTCTGLNTAPDVVYKLQMTCDYQVTVSLCGSGYDTQLFVESEDCAIGGEFSRFCNDDFCGTQSQLTFTAAAGQLYSIWVDGYASAWGNYVINVTGFSTGAQENAQCPGTTITTVPYFTYAATYCGGNNFTPNCSVSNAEDVVYRWVSPYNQAMRAKTCYSNFDTILEIRRGGNCPGSFLVGCNDDTPCAGDNLTSAVVFDASATQTYYMHLDGYSTAQGITSFELEAFNDDCTSPIVVPSLPANYQGDTRAGRDDFATVVGPASKELFFRYTSPVCQTVGVRTCDPSTNFDTGLEVRTGGPCPGTTIVAWNDDNAACTNNSLQSLLTFQAEAGRTYYIIVSGYGTAEGQFMIYFTGGPVQGAPIADVCPGIAIPALPFTDYGNTTCMANNYATCVGAASREMVYNLSVSACQEVTVSLCGSGYDTGLGVYSGACPGLGSLIACNDDSFCGDDFTYQSTVTFTAQPNVNYNILVHGYATNSGAYTINVTGQPCAPPPPVEDQVAQFDPATGNVVLTWGASPGATQYHVYRSSHYATLFSPGNIVATVNGTSYTCAGCINEAPMLSFFGVLAVNDPGAGPLLADSRTPAVEVPAPGKNAAVMGPLAPGIDQPFPEELGLFEPVQKPVHDGTSQPAE